MWERARSRESRVRGLDSAGGRDELGATGMGRDGLAGVESAARGLQRVVEVQKGQGTLCWRPRAFE